MKTKLALAFSLLAFNVSFNTTANAVDGDQFCKKIQSCMYEQMAKEDMPADMMKSMKPMIDGMCAAMQGKLDEAAAQQGANVEACINAMANASCTQMMEEPESIPECASLEKAYIEKNNQ